MSSQPAQQERDVAPLVPLEPVDVGDRHGLAAAVYAVNALFRRCGEQEVELVATRGRVARLLEGADSRRLALLLEQWYMDTVDADATELLLQRLPPLVERDDAERYQYGPVVNDIEWSALATVYKVCIAVKFIASKAVAGKDPRYMPGWKIAVPTPKIFGAPSLKGGHAAMGQSCVFVVAHLSPKGSTFVPLIPADQPIFAPGRPLTGVGRASEKAAKSQAAASSVATGGNDNESGTEPQVNFEGYKDRPASAGKRVSFHPTIVSTPDRPGSTDAVESQSPAAQSASSQPTRVPSHEQDSSVRPDAPGEQNTDEANVVPTGTVHGDDEQKDRTSGHRAENAEKTETKYINGVSDESAQTATAESDPAAAVSDSQAVEADDALSEVDRTSVDAGDASTRTQRDSEEKASPKTWLASAGTIAPTETPNDGNKVTMPSSSGLDAVEDPFASAKAAIADAAAKAKAKMMDTTSAEELACAGSDTSATESTVTETPSPAKVIWPSTNNSDAVGATSSNGAVATAAATEGVPEQARRTDETLPPAAEEAGVGADVTTSTAGTLPNVDEAASQTHNLHSDHAGTSSADVDDAPSTQNANPTTASSVDSDNAPDVTSKTVAAESPQAPADAEVVERRAATDKIAHFIDNFSVESSAASTTDTTKASRAETEQVGDEAPSLEHVQSSIKDAPGASAASASTPNGTPVSSHRNASQVDESEAAGRATLNADEEVDKAALPALPAEKEPESASAASLDSAGGRSHDETKAKTDTASPSSALGLEKGEEGIESKNSSNTGASAPSPTSNASAVTPPNSEHESSPTRSPPPSPEDGDTRRRAAPTSKLNPRALPPRAPTLVARKHGMRTELEVEELFDATALVQRVYGTPRASSRLGMYGKRVQKEPQSLTEAVARVHKAVG